MNARKLAVMAGMAAATALLVVACKGKGNLSVSAKATATDGGTSSGSLDLGQGILVDRVRIVVRKIVLEGAPAAADAGVPDAGAPDASTMMMPLAGRPGTADHGGGDDGDDDGDDHDEVKVGPFLIDLTGDQMNGGIHQVFDADVPPGTYHEIKFVIHEVDAADGGVSADIAAMNGASVIIDGTVAQAATTDGGTPDADGGTSDAGTVAAPFSFVSDLNASQKQETEMTVTVDSSTQNVTLSIDPTGWFKAEDGSRLDPTVADDQKAIEKNIKASIRAFKDDDEDGEDDMGEHGGDGGHGDGHGDGHH